MSESPAPYPYTPEPGFPNSDCFLNSDASILTLAIANRYYFRKSGDYASYVNSSLYQLDGNVIGMSYITGITAGTATASKALVLDASKNITGITNLSATTLNAVSQFNCTGNATYSSVNGTILFSGNSSLINMTGSGSKITLTGNSTSIELTGTSGHIDLTNTQASNSLSTGTIRSAGGAYFGNDCVFATQASFGSSVINQTNAGYIVSISAGTVSASKAVVVDINKDISSFRNLTATNLTATSIVTANEIDLATNIRFVTSGGVNYIQSGTALSGGSSADLFVGNMLTVYTGSARAFMIKNTGKVGIQSYAPTKQLDINSATGSCLRLQYNSSNDGTGINNVDFDVSSAGSLTITTTSGSVLLPTVSGGDILTLSSTATGARNTIKFSGDTQNWEIGTRNSTASNPNSFYIYNAAYKLLMNAGGDTQILSATDSTSTSTGCLQLLGGLGIVKALNVGAKILCNTNQSPSQLNIGGVTATGISFMNSTTSQAKGCFIGTDSTANIILTAQDTTTPLSAQYILDTSGRIGCGQRATSSNVPRAPIDMGTYISDANILLYAPTSAGSPIYSIGANNSSVEYSSAGNHKFYYNTLLTGSTATLGTLQMTIDPSNNLTVMNNVFATSYFSTGFSATGLSGSGLKMHYSGIGEIFTYNYSGGSYIHTKLGNNNVQLHTNGYTSLNTSSQASSFPLSVFGTDTGTRSGTFGHLSPAGAGTATGFTNRPFSIYSAGGILVDGGEIDSFSDIRLKKDIIELDDDICNRFINKIKPIKFKYKLNDSRFHFGYSAQQLLKYKFNTIVGFTPSDLVKKDGDQLEEMNIECYDGSGKIKLTSDVRLTIAQLDLIPLLHGSLQISNERIKQNEIEIKELKETINKLDGLVEFFNNVVISINNNVDAIMNLYKWKDTLEITDESTDSDNNTSSEVVESDIEFKPISISKIDLKK